MPSGIILAIAFAGLLSADLPPCMTVAISLGVRYGRFYGMPKAGDLRRSRDVIAVTCAYRRVDCTTANRTICLEPSRTSPSNKSGTHKAAARGSQKWVGGLNRSRGRGSFVDGPRGG